MYSNNSNNNNNNINALNYDFDLDEFLTNVVMLDNISFPSTSSTTSSSSTPSPSLDSGKTTVNTFQGPTFGNTTSMKQQQQQQQQQQPLMSQRQQQTEQQQHSFFQQSKDVKNISNQPVYQQQQQQQVLAEQQLSQHVQKHPRLYDQQQQQQQSSDFNALPLSSSFTFPNTNILSDNQSGSNQLSLHQQIQQQYFQHQQAKQQQAVSNAQQMQNQTGVLMSESKFQHHHTSSTIASANATLGATTTATSTATNAPTLAAENNDNIKKTTMLTKKRNSEDFDVDDMDDDGDDMDSSDNKKSPWTLDEDLKLVQLFNEFGSSWSRISNVMQTRNKIDIKNRFRSIIRARNRIWTPEEDEKLLQLHEELGSNWQIIQSHFSNRTRHALRVRYKYLRDNKPSETTGGESSQHSPPELLVPGSPYQVLIYCRENVTYSPLLSTINKCAKQSPKPPLKNKLESPAPSTFVPKRSSSLAASTPKQTIQPVATPISSAIGRKQSSGMSSAASTPATIAVIPTHYNTNDEMRSSLPSNEAYIKYERDDSIFGTFDFPPIETGFEDASGFASYEESVLDSDYKL